ncbi:hypothetical protein I3U53_24595 [Mycobacteroides abscessus subsp. abscessus]|nr:hypothetical protein [Mycobacteroides abscessus subsp. abscessus]
MNHMNLSTVADIIGIFAAFLAGLSWFKARKHSKKAEQSLSIIQNYRTIEIFTEVNRRIDTIKVNIRSIKKGSNLQRVYGEIESLINDIVNDIPTTYTQLIEELREIERAIQNSKDKNEPLVDEDQYKILDRIDTIKIMTKTIVENLRKGT